MLSKDDSPIMLFEMEQDFIERFNYECANMINFLTDLHYDLFALSYGKAKSLKKNDIIEKCNTRSFIARKNSSNKKREKITL